MFIVVKRRSTLRHNAAGFGIVESMVALAILSVGLLGLMSLQLSALRNTHSAQLRSQATLMVWDIAERMRANRTVALARSYDTTFTDVAPTTTSSLRDIDLAEWKNNISLRLPGGQGAITTVTASSTATITVRWDDSHGSGGSSAQQWEQQVHL